MTKEQKIKVLAELGEWTFGICEYRGYRGDGWQSKDGLRIDFLPKKKTYFKYD